MSWLDRAISFISPKWGASRAAWRGAMEEIRNYDAGSFGRLNANWRVFNESAEQTDKNEREYVRARARDLERNSDIMNSVIGAYKRNVIGRGFQLQATAFEDDADDQVDHPVFSRWIPDCYESTCDLDSWRTAWMSSYNPS